MVNNILVPVDIKPAEFNLAEYARFFQHLPGKRFSAFFLHDFVPPKAHKNLPAVDWSKFDLEETIADEARKLKLEFTFLSCPISSQSLAYQSCFADLILVSPVNEESLHFINYSLSIDFFSSMGCPVFLTTQLQHPFEEIIFLFDYDMAALEALKAFTNLFGQVAAAKKVTVVTVSPEEDSHVYFEKCLISYVQRTFSDVGILPMTRSNLLQGLMEFASQEKEAVIIMGISALELIKNETLSKELIHQRMSLFFCNH